MTETGAAFREFDWKEAEHITMLSEEDLKDRLEAFSEEKALSCRLRILHGRVDPLHAELVRRGSAALPPEDLARVLLGGSPEGTPL